jgi:hypothetical protein
MYQYFEVPGILGHTWVITDRTTNGGSTFKWLRRRIAVLGSRPLLGPRRIRVHWPRRTRTHCTSTSVVRDAPDLGRHSDGIKMTIWKRNDLAPGLFIHQTFLDRVCSAGSKAGISTAAYYIPTGVGTDHAGRGTNYPPQLPRGGGDW